MIQDLLDSNQIRSGEKLSLYFEFGDLRVITKVTLEETASVQGDHFILETTDPMITGYWDSLYLQRAIENLATNAVKYGNPNSPVRVSLSQTPTTVSIAVHNEGTPLNPDEK